MSYQKKLEDLLKKKNGMLLTKDIIEAGISKQLLTTYVRQGYIERVGHGVYLSNDALEDEMYALQVGSSLAVFSHGTALFHHDLSDRDPLNYTITIPTGYNASKFKESGIEVYYVKRELLELGLIVGKTVFGREVRIYDKERAICDVIRSRNTMDISIVNDSLKRYIASKDKDISKLLKYAKAFKIDKVLRTYLEVLL